MPYYPEEMSYSDKYYDENYEYRNVSLPRELYKKIRGKGILSEIEWRSLGVAQSRGWAHYAVFKPEPYILLFRKTREESTRPSSNSNEMEIEQLKSEEILEKCI